MRQFQRAIFFTKVPLNGYYKHEDRFQIFPLNLENMLHSSFQRHFPNILEFWTTEDEEIQIFNELEISDNLKKHFSSAAAVVAKQDKILRLFSAFTNNLFFRYSDATGNWGIPMLNDNPGDEEDEWSSAWCLKLYNFPQLAKHLKIDNFTEQNIPLIKRVSFKLFYRDDPNLDFDKDKEVVFPDTIDLLFKSYYNIDESKIPFLDAAISYTVSAIELKDSMKTLSLLASFTSMETMVNLEFKDFTIEPCESCGQQKYSVSRKFREYLLKYIGTSEHNKRKFNSYYTLRSKIVHTGQQLKTELLFTDVPKNEQDLEFVTRIEILQLGKLAIAKWLLHNLLEKQQLH